MSVASPPGPRKIVDKAELLPLAREVEARLAQAGSIEELRYAFEESYGRLGWRVLCRLFVLHQTPEEALRLRQHRNGRE